MTPKYFYHCTTEYVGSTLTVHRRKPKYAADGEPAVPRLCVCPSIAECFAARLFQEASPVYCYRTRKLVRGIAPYSTWDACITRERWLIPPMQLSLVCTVPAQISIAAQEAVRLYHRKTRRKSSWKLRLMQLLEAAEVLSRWNANTIDIRRTSFLKRFAGGYNLQTVDPWMFILKSIDSLD